MSAKHTPGPWQFDQIKHGDYWVGTEDADIATVEGFGADFEKESEANARLIAAAPDLLLALERCMRRAQKHPDDDDSDRRRDLYHIEAYARVAIAKATGAKP